MSEPAPSLKSYAPSSPPGSFDERILAVLEQLPISGVEEICRALFPEVDWIACQKPKVWPEFGGAFVSTAVLVHWRCLVLVQRQVIRQADPILTDRFAGPLPILKSIRTSEG